MNTPSATLPVLAHATAAQARAAFRAGAVAPTAGLAGGHTQANLIAVPREHANDMLLFAQRNWKPCPVLEATEPGGWTCELAPGADLRTDLPRYRVWRNGRLAGTPRQVTGLWRDDLVTFLIGCSFSFETALQAAGIPLRHLEQHRNVAMYITDRLTRPAGALRGPLVVSMRPIPAHLVAEAARVTAAMPDMHGAPLLAGDPRDLGIGDLAAPDFGEPVEFADGGVPVFWACGVTSQIALQHAAWPFAITHDPGHMLITDAWDVDYWTDPAP